MDWCVLLWNVISLKDSAALFLSKIQSHVCHCFPFYLLCMKNNIWQQKTSLFQIVWRCKLSALSFCQLFHFGCITPSCLKHQKWTNILFGLSTSEGEWGVSSTADYINLLVHLCVTGGAPPPTMKRQSAGTIGSDSPAGGALPSQSSDNCLQTGMLMTDTTKKEKLREKSGCLSVCLTLLVSTSCSVIEDKMCGFGTHRLRHWT